MLPKAISDAPIVFRAEPIGRGAVGRFAQATCSEHFGSMPLTFPTVLRETEFMWLERLQIDMRELLHTDQEYEYLTDLQDGDVPTVYSRITDYRERRGLTFVGLESEIRCGDRVAVIARASFVVRSQEGSGD